MLWHQRISRSGIGGDIWNLKRVGDDKVAYLCTIADLPRYLRRPYRLDLATGDFTAESDGLRNYTRFLHDDGLVDLGDRPRNHLGLLRDGSLRWLIPASAAFPKGSSSDDIGA